MPQSKILRFNLPVNAWFHEIPCCHTTGWLDKCITVQGYKYSWSVSVYCSHDWLEKYILRQYYHNQDIYLISDYLQVHLLLKKYRKRNRITKEIQYEILKKFIWLSGYHEICTFILSIAPKSKWSDKNWQCSPAVHKAHANLIVFHIDFFTLNKTLPWKWRKCPWRDPQFSLAVVTLILMAVHVRPVLWFLSLCECGIYCEDKRFRNQHHFPLN